MDPPDHLPPPPSSLTNGADGGPTATPLQPVSVVNDSGTAAKPSFADMASKGLKNSKAEIRSAWSSVRANTEARDPSPSEQSQAVWFTNHSKGYIAAIPYHARTHLITDVVAAIVKTFPHSMRINLAVPGVILIAFRSQEELAAALEAKVDCTPSSLKVLPTVFSNGTRIKIRAENTPIGLVDYKEFAQKIFGSYGKILLVNQHFVAGTTVSLSSFDFILEIPFGTSQDLMIPRVAAIDNVNTVFSWSSSKFCYRCGEGSHSKLECPKPLDFYLASAAPVEEPIMARAFPDPEAPLRALPKKATPPNPGPVPSKQVSPLVSEWTEVKRGKDKKRGRDAFSGGEVTSASDSDTPKPPPRKQAPHRQGSNSASSSKSNGASQAKKDINSAAPSSAISTAKAESARAPAESEKAASVQKPAKSDEATQISSAGDTPKQQTEPQQQEIEQQTPEMKEPIVQQKEEEMKQQEPIQQDRQQVQNHPLDQSDETPLEEMDTTQELTLGEEVTEDAHMSSKGEDAAMEKGHKAAKLLMAASQKQVDKSSKTLASRSTKIGKKTMTKTG
jgi:hypothetical protein